MDFDGKKEPNTVGNVKNQTGKKQATKVHLG